MQETRNEGTFWHSLDTLVETSNIIITEHTTTGWRSRANSCIVVTELASVMSLNANLMEKEYKYVQHVLTLTRFSS